jgi:mono/diheme cytochrome c family protein
MKRLAWPALAAAAGLLLAGCEPLDPMARRQPKILPYQPSQFYADGLSMRPPPEGTVPTKGVLAPVAATGLGPSGTPVERIPVSITPALLEVGRKRFEIICATCHGLLADGNSAVAPNMSLRRPPSLQENVGRPDGFYFQVITRGYGLMPSYANALPVQERWAVVAYLRALQLSQRGQVGEAPPDVRARLEREPR